MSTEFLPTLARSVAERVTVALIELTTWVGRWAPFHSTTHLGQKLRPLTRKVKPALPAVACAGESRLRTGYGPRHNSMSFSRVEAASLGGTTGCSAMASDTTKVRKTNKRQRLVTGDSPKIVGSYAGIGHL